MQIICTFLYFIFTVKHITYVSVLLVSSTSVFEPICVSPHVYLNFKKMAVIGGMGNFC